MKLELPDLEKRLDTTNAELAEVKTLLAKLLRVTVIAHGGTFDEVDETTGR